MKAPMNPFYVCDKCDTLYENKDELNRCPFCFEGKLGSFPLQAAFLASDIENLIKAHIEAKIKWDFSKDEVHIKMMGESSQQIVIEELESLLAALEVGEE